MPPRTALVVGRFQPLHRGHVAVIDAALATADAVILAVGSSQYEGTPDNPFSFEERRAMLQAVFGDRVRIVAVPDIHDDDRWVRHVQDTVGRFDLVVGNDDRTLRLFEAASVPVERTGLRQRKTLQAATIRAQMAADDPAWRDAVPPKAATVLEKIQGPERIQGLSHART